VEPFLFSLSLSLSLSRFPLPFRRLPPPTEAVFGGLAEAQLEEASELTSILQFKVLAFEKAAES
jgi:hypothetical protein